jgi:hypothetical protein
LQEAAMPLPGPVPNTLFRDLRQHLFGGRETLADAVNKLLPAAYAVTANDIGKIERGKVTWPRGPRREAYRQALQVGNDEEIGFFNSRTQQPAIADVPTSALLRSGAPGAGQETFPAHVMARGDDHQPQLRSEIHHREYWRAALMRPHDEDSFPAAPPTHVLATPAGRALPGLALPAQLHPAVRSGQVVAQVPAGYAADPFLRRSGRALVVGQVRTDEPAAFVLDSRHARQRLRAAPAEARLLIPAAYLLDELTYALLWAVANFDAELLADDAALAEGLRDATGYTQLRRSAVSRDLAADLSPASLMWLGSEFCAGHILRHFADLTGPPTFWTREQRGEQAAAWLLFSHKQSYLRATARTSSAETVTRVFCVPGDAVASSPVGERALLLLAVALMESYNVTTATTDVAELATMPGFVLDRQQTAITATWLGADGIWYVDVTDNRSTLRDYADAAEHAVQHAVTAASTPAGRLRRLADYLDLDWRWLATRCRELGEIGTNGIAQPRSRLLSLDGVDRACRFIAACAEQPD